MAPLNVGLTDVFFENGAPFDCEALASTSPAGPATSGAELVGAFATAAGGRGLLRLTCEEPPAALQVRSPPRQRPDA